jgi:hypothetical protein
MARDAVQGTLRNIQVSKRDAEAILAAAETHLYEVWLAEDVLTRIMLPKQEDEPEKVYATPVKAGLWQGNGAANTVTHSLGSRITANIASSSTAQYVEQVYRMEQEKYRLELEKLRQQDNEHAMRNTKPFTGFI